MRTRYNRSSSRRGVTLVEFSLTFPILLIFVIGMIEFVRMHTLHHAADNAAYEAARHVIVPGASKSEAITRANELLARTGVSDGSYTITPSVITEATTKVTVQVSIPLSKNSWIPAHLIPDHTIVRETTLLTERGHRPEDIIVGGGDGDDYDDD